MLLVRARGAALRLGVCLLGFPAVVCAATPIPPIASLCNSCKQARNLALFELFLFFFGQNLGFTEAGGSHMHAC